MSNKEDALAYGDDYSNERGSGPQGTDRGIVGDTFKFLKTKYKQAQQPAQSQSPYGYTEQAQGSTNKQYQTGQGGYVRHPTQHWPSMVTKLTTFNRIQATVINLLTRVDHLLKHHSRSRTLSRRSSTHCMASYMALVQNSLANSVASMCHKRPPSLTYRAETCLRKLGIKRGGKPTTDTIASPDRRMEMT